MAKSRYDRLFSPGRIGTLQLKNRLVYPPMGTNVCLGGDVSDRLIAYHEARARGGAGMVIVENANVDSAGAAGLPLGLNIDDDNVTMSSPTSPKVPVLAAAEPSSTVTDALSAVTVGATLFTARANWTVVLARSLSVAVMVTV